MTTTSSWRELYQAALLELRPKELRPRIDAAVAGIQQRVEHLRLSDSNSAGELRDLDDALRGLRLLERTECASENRAPGSDRRVAS